MDQVRRQVQIQGAGSQWIGRPRGHHCRYRLAARSTVLANGFRGVPGRILGLPGYPGTGQRSFAAVASDTDGIDPDPGRLVALGRLEMIEPHFRSIDHYAFPGCLRQDVPGGQQYLRALPRQP